MLSETSQEKLKHFFSRYKLLQHGKRELILQAKDSTTSVFFILSGYIRVYKILEQGEELTLSILKPKEFFPMTFRIFESANPYFLEAITELTYFSAPKKAFLEFMKEEPQLYIELTAGLLVRLDGVMSRMEYLLFSNAYTKVATTLLVCAKRFGEIQKGMTYIKVPLTHRDIATMVGLTRETTSLEMKKLENDGYIVKIGRNLAIQNIKSLQSSVMFQTEESSSIHYSV